MSIRTPGARLEPDAAEGCLALVLVVLWIIPATLLNAYVLAHLWRWFAVPIFGLHPLTYAEAAGVSLLVGFLTHQVNQNDSDPEDGPLATWAGGVVRMLLVCGLSLGLGAAIHGWWM